MAPEKLCARSKILWFIHTPFRLPVSATWINMNKWQKKNEYFFHWNISSVAGVALCAIQALFFTKFYRSESNKCKKNQSHVSKHESEEILQFVHSPDWEGCLLYSTEYTHIPILSIKPNTWARLPMRLSKIRELNSNAHIINIKSIVNAIILDRFFSPRSLFIALDQFILSSSVYCRRHCCCAYQLHIICYGRMPISYHLNYLFSSYFTAFVWSCQFIFIWFGVLGLVETIDWNLLNPINVTIVTVRTW